jgi:hypothetical protein
MNTWDQHLTIQIKRRLNMPAYKFQLVHLPSLSHDLWPKNIRDPNFYVEVNLVNQNLEVSWYAIIRVLGADPPQVKRRAYCTPIKRLRTFDSAREALLLLTASLNPGTCIRRVTVTAHRQIEGSRAYHVRQLRAPIPCGV